MENLENENLHPENEHTDEAFPRADAEQNPGEPEQQDTNAKQKQSPFADSPYVMHPEKDQPETVYFHPVPPEMPPARRKKQKGKLWRQVLAAMLVIALVAAGCGITAALVNQRWQEKIHSVAMDFDSRLNAMQAQVDAAAEAAAAAAGNGDYSAPSAVVMTPSYVYSQNVESVVLVTSEVTSSMFGKATTGISNGSGFILSENGYVVTNHHVIEGATSVTVSTYGGEIYDAKVVGSDSANDVAVLKVEASDLPAVRVGSSAALNVGDQVVAIGNPLGELTATMTAGYVSAKNRDVTTDNVTINMIQTDAAINSGNSGGPLFNMKGEVVGITTAKYSGASSSGASIEGIGFAIPIDDVIGMVEDLVNFGYVTGAYLGVMVRDMDPVQADFYSLPVGAYVQEVTPGYCAEAAGLQVKDIIVALGDYKVTNISTLTRALRNYKAGDTTQLTVFRSGRELVLDITLDEKPVAAESTDPIIPNEGQMPQNGNYEEWYNYFAPFFGNGNNNG